MSNIRYVCISDLHLGEKDSLLTELGPDPSGINPLQPSKVMVELVNCLRYLISKNDIQSPKPTLILNGDILDLALATVDDAAMVFERFIELIMPQGSELFEEIIYVPGNHDHHLWEFARESQYIDYLHRNPIEPFNTPWHTTNIFKRRKRNIQYDLLTELARRTGCPKELVITTAYPNFGLPERNNGTGKCIVFTHGHFIETIYYLVSTLRNIILPNREPPKHVWDIEAENFAWIDFFWSMLGRSGDIGKDIEAIYERLRDADDRRKFLGYLIRRIAMKYPLPWLILLPLYPVLVYFGMKIFSLEKHETNKRLSQKAFNGLQKYVTGPVCEQIHAEHRKTPTDLTIVFGHTHKPFSEVRDFNFRESLKSVKVYNSGGWVVESKRPQPRHGGAVIVVDDDLNCASIKIMYNEHDGPKNYTVGLECAEDDGKPSPSSPPPNPLYQRLLPLVNPKTPPWKEFSQVTAEEVSKRIEKLKDRLKRPLSYRP
jgi:UDP-2,3-diacylglucosamine pyrophosphatase LpxH